MSEDSSDSSGSTTEDQTIRPKAYRWFHSVLLAVDQLGNALAGGYHDSTISARVGYNARHGNAITRNYWRLLEWMINFSFEPLDGPDHCYQSYLAGKRPHYRHGSDLMRAILGLLILVMAIPIAIVTRLMALFKA